MRSRFRRFKSRRADGWHRLDERTDLVERWGLYSKGKLIGEVNGLGRDRALCFSAFCAEHLGHYQDVNDAKRRVESKAADMLMQALKDAIDRSLVKTDADQRGVVGIIATDPKKNA